MIIRFRHKGLERLFVAGSTAGIQPSQVGRLRLILSVLNQAASLRDVGLPGLRLHPLKGALQGRHAVAVSGNWRVVFRFEDNDVTDVDLVDYH